MNLVLFSSSAGCRWAKDLPILKIPDGNKDRMRKASFSGDSKNPKYWLSKVTVVNASFGSAPFTFEGLQSEVKVGYFEFTRDKLQFYNAVTRQSLEDPETASQGAAELINEWSIEHSEFRLAEVDGYTTNREEENKYIPWHKKTYFTVDWSQANISEASTFPYAAFAEKQDCWSKKTAHAVDSSRRITKNYISFVIAVQYEQNPTCAEELRRRLWGDFVTTVYYKYSFKKTPDPRLPDKNYSPYIYDGEHDPLLKKYGYFRTVRPVIADDNRDKNVFYMNRWNPDKKHIFYFSEDYPDKYKDIAHGVICRTNKLFAEQGLNNYPLNGKCADDGSALPEKNETCDQGICFELRENTGQKFGDIRYSFFHMLNADSWVFGYGPLDAHPATGEIIGGNIVISTFLLDFYLKHLFQLYYKRDLSEIYDEKGERQKNKTKYETSSLFVKMRQTLKEEERQLWTQSSKWIDGASDIRPDFEYLVSQLTFGYPPYSDFTNAKAISQKAEFDFNEKLLPQFMPKHIIKKAKSLIQQSHKDLKKQFSHQRNTTIYPLEPILSQLPSLLANGMGPEEIKRKILFNLMSHEFGHVLGLRHNFYGSFDSRHYHKEGDEVSKTSSIMDYMSLKEEAQGPSRAFWGPYDKAALAYAYSGGKKDLSKELGEQYLFCSDHHVPLNFLCNRFDEGDTPSRVMMNLIERYEERYFISNLRLDRAFWDTSSYPARIFRAMWDLKRALMMWRTAFRGNNMTEILDKSNKNYSPEKTNLITEQISRDIKQAIKLSLAFYNSVLQLSSADRDWKDFYNEESGSIEKIGVFWDKLFSMLFLMGDEGFLYNINQYLGKASYLTYINDLGFRQMIEEIMENTLTVRVDMEPWFIGYGRYLYAKNASNSYNIALNGNLLEAIGVRCYTPKGLKDRFGIDPRSYKVREDSPEDRLDVAVVLMEDYLDKITDAYYDGTNEKLGIAFFDGNYYVAASSLNKYTFTIIDNMRRVTHSAGASLRRDKQDLYDMYYLYHQFKKGGAAPQNCDNGD